MYAPYLLMSLDRRFAPGGRGFLTAKERSPDRKDGLGIIGPSGGI